MQATHFDCEIRDAGVALCSDLDGRIWGEREGRGGEKGGSWRLGSGIRCFLASGITTRFVSDLNPIESNLHLLGV